MTSESNVPPTSGDTQGQPNTESQPKPWEVPKQGDALGFFWRDSPQRKYDARHRGNPGFPQPLPDHIPNVQIGDGLKQQHAKAQFDLPKGVYGGTIDADEWDQAQPSPFEIVEDWFFADVGLLVGPGGTGKTTLLLFEAVHIVLGLELFGYKVVNPGPVVILTAEDSREMLVARLRMVCYSLGLSPQQQAKVRAEIRILDVAGKSFKLTNVRRDVVEPSQNVDRLVHFAKSISPEVIFIDPAVSFGVGESRVNDAEQGLIDAGRRIRNELSCALIYSHHTGKESARNKALDQYAARGGSAFSDGSRMVHILQRLEPNEWLEGTGDELKPNEGGLVLARPKISHSRPQPNMYIKRCGYRFERYDQSDNHMAVLHINAEKVWALLKEEVDAGRFPTQRSVVVIAAERGIKQKPFREAVAWLISSQRVRETPVDGIGRGGARNYLRPVELPKVTTGA